MLLSHSSAHRGKKVQYFSTLFFLFSSKVKENLKIKLMMKILCNYNNTKQFRI